MEVKQWLRRTLGLFLIATLAISCQKEDVEKSAETKTTGPKAELEAFVQMAAAEIEKRGEEAFADFRETDGIWFKGDKYLFVFDLEGNAICHPINPDLEGTNMLDTQDPDGVAPMQQMLSIVQEGGSGWVNYKWPKPGSGEPVDKSSFVTTAKFGDSTVAVGSGIYPEPAVSEK